MRSRQFTSVTSRSSLLLLGRAALPGLKAAIKPVGPSVKHGQRSHENAKHRLLHRGRVTGAFGF